MRFAGPTKQALRVSGARGRFARAGRQFESEHSESLAHTCQAGPTVMLVLGFFADAHLVVQGEVWIYSTSWCIIPQFF
jgi:hypothetical protein